MFMKKVHNYFCRNKGFPKITIFKKIPKLRFKYFSRITIAFTRHETKLILRQKAFNKISETNAHRNKIRYVKFRHGILNQEYLSMDPLFPN